ncbi:MAG: FG-GAP repeat domain-containing protein [Candidatus Krumholzibacteriia bacterium]
MVADYRENRQVPELPARYRGSPDLAPGGGGGASRRPRHHRLKAEYGSRQRFVAPCDPARNQRSAGIRPLLAALVIFVARFVEPRIHHVHPNRRPRRMLYFHFPPVHPPEGVVAMRVPAMLASAVTSLIVAAGPSVATETGASFGLAWDSGETLNNIRCLGVGDLDADRHLEIMAGSWNPGVLHLYELTASKVCVETWTSVGTPTGSLVSSVFADTDLDGRMEILALCAPLGRVLIFEQQAGGYEFVSDGVQEYDSNCLMFADEIMVGDTDRDGLQEIIVFSRDIHNGPGQITIWEQSGVPGQHAYRRVFTYSTRLHLTGATIGDSDNDGWPEIVLGVALAGGMIVDRLEYDSAAATWVNRVFQTGENAMGLTPHVADIDRDGRNELLLGTNENRSTASFLYVLESTGPDSYSVRFRGDGPLHGFVTAVATGRFAMPDGDVIAAGSEYGDVVLWRFDHRRDTFEPYAQLPGLGGVVDGLALTDIGGGRAEVVVALGQGGQQLRVYRRHPGTGGIPPPGNLSATAPRLVAQPNPFRGTTALRVADQMQADGARIFVFDCRGRRVRALSLAGSELAGAEAAWDGCDEQGRPAPAGVYYCRVVTPGNSGPATRVVRLR